MRRPDFPEEGCRATVRAPRWYRPAPSGLKGAAHRARARRPAAALDPGDLWQATGPAKRAAPRGLPRVSSGALPSRAASRWPALHPPPERRDIGIRQPPPDTSVHLFDYVNRRKNYETDRQSAAKLSLNQSRGAPAIQLIPRRSPSPATPRPPVPPARCPHIPATWPQPPSAAAAAAHPHEAGSCQPSPPAPAHRSP